MRLLLFFLALVSLMFSHGQGSVPYLSGAYHKGFVIVHSRAVRAIEDSYPQGFQLDFGKHNTSEKIWNACNCYPRTGVSLTFWDFDNPDVLGYGLSGVFYLQPVFRADKDFSFSVRGGIGLSYKTNPHHPVSNPDNQSYSTSVAFPLELGLGFHYKLGELWQIEARMMYKHISNGGMRQPNKGINWPTAGLAISRYLRPISFPERKKTDWRLNASERIRNDLSAFATYQEPTDGIYLVSGGIEIKHARRIGRLSNISIGAEWMYDTNQAKLSEGKRRETGHHTGAAIGHEFILGKFLFSQQFGVYFLKPSSRPEDLYQRYGLNYRLNPSLLVGDSLKAHGHVADFLDLRMGFSF
ncbi:MAG TPA: acyloxyacyl hydrolase [Cryomorphaceae bacterium]|nr:acyloxyacyl hydrolase [Cryomorphaceae bacterium]